MDRILYIDPWGGASGDMFLAALVDAGCDLRARAAAADEEGAAGIPDPEQTLHDAVAALGLTGVGVRIAPAIEGGFACRRVEVTDEAAATTRTLADLERLLGHARLAEPVVATARAALGRLAEEEARLHGVTVDLVHLHELGAVDTLVDVVGTLAVVHALGVRRAVHGPVPVGAGRIGCAHGSLGVPAPATLGLLRGRPVFGGAERSEVTTPTGALLITQLAAAWGPMPPMRVEAVGYGAGSRALEHGPNLLRLVLGEPLEGPVGADVRSGTGAWSSARGGSDVVVELRTTIDDASPEVLGHLHGLLSAAGVLESWSTPVYMKKGRPAVELTVLCDPAHEAAVVDVVMRESTAFGVRRAEVARHVLDRSWVDVDVGGCAVQVKVGSRGGAVFSVSPEYESAAAAAEKLGRPLKDVMRDAACAAARTLEPSDR